jgi:hypothetical protein
MGKLKKAKLSWIWIIYFLVTAITGISCQKKYEIKVSGVRSMSNAHFEIEEDSGPKTFKLPVLDEKSEYRIIFNGDIVTPSDSKTFLNGKLLAFNSNDGSFTYQPESNYSGAQQFDFEVFDVVDQYWHHLTADLNVTAVNDQVLAQDLFLEVELSQIVEISLNNFLSLDIDGDELKIYPLNKEGQIVDINSGDWGFVRNSLTNPNGLQAISQSLGAHSVQVRISDSKSFIDVTLTLSPRNPLIGFHPSLAVNKPYCLMCHSQVDGNFVSSLGATEGKNDVSIFTHKKFGQMQFGDYLSNWTDHGGKLFSMTSFIKGTLFVPHLLLDDEAKSSIKTVIKEAIDGQAVVKDSSPIKILDFTGLASDLISLLTAPLTGAQYYHAISNFRTKEYLDYLRTGAYTQKTLEPELTVREVRTVKISAPAHSEIMARISPDEKLHYYPQGDQASELKNFQSVVSILKPENSYFSNLPDSVMECDGDIFVDGVVFLKNLKLKTKFGCRIYATGTIFVNGNLIDGQGTHNGFLLVEPTAASALELTSVRGLTLGLGYCDPTSNASIKKRLVFPSALKAPDEMLADVDILVGETASTSLMFDASDGVNNPEYKCSNYLANINRNVKFEHILLNAPIIHSRYTGDFRGVIIADFVLWSLGKFKYQYDPIFDSVPILPMLPPESFFKVVECEPENIVRTDTLLHECRP